MVLLGIEEYNASPKCIHRKVVDSFDSVANVRQAAQDAELDNADSTLCFVDESSAIVNIAFNTVP